MNDDLHALFLSSLSYMLDAENQLIEALPKMAEAAQSEELAAAFNDHLEETKGHVERLKQVFESVDAEPDSKPCPAMKGIVAAGAGMMEELKGNRALDAGLIAAAQKAEHFEIASYGSLSSWADQMGHADAVDLLEQTLEEEKAADEKLSGIAESEANDEAKSD